MQDGWMAWRWRTCCGRTSYLERLLDQLSRERQAFERTSPCWECWQNLKNVSDTNQKDEASLKSKRWSILDDLTVVVLECLCFWINSILHLVLEGKLDMRQELSKHLDNCIDSVFGKKALLKVEVCDHCMHILLIVITVSVLQATNEKWIKFVGKITDSKYNFRKRPQMSDSVSYIIYKQISWIISNCWIHLARSSKKDFKKRPGLSDFGSR